MPQRMKVGVSAVTVMVSGTSVGTFTTFLADSEPLPEPIRYLLGPLGALAGTLLAVYWLTKRLNRLELETKEARDAETERRDIVEERMIEIVSKQTEVAALSTEAINRNTETLNRVIDLIQSK